LGLGNENNNVRTDSLALLVSNKMVLQLVYSILNRGSQRYPH